MSISKKPIIILYGPPGVGKLTVAKELSRLTNLPLFHNHLSRDLVHSVFENGKNYDLTEKIRLDFFEFAAENSLGLIFTFVYAYQTDDVFMDKLLEIAQKSDTEIYFIQLLCDPKIWKERLESEERTAYKKVRDFNLVQETMKEHDLLTAYPKAKNHQTLEVANLKPEESAQIIKNFTKS